MSALLDLSAGSKERFENSDALHVSVENDALSPNFRVCRPPV